METTIKEPRVIILAIKEDPTIILMLVIMASMNPLLLLTITITVIMLDIMDMVIMIIVTITMEETLTPIMMPSTCGKLDLLTNKTPASYPMEDMPYLLLIIMILIRMDFIMIMRTTMIIQWAICLKASWIYKAIIIIINLFVNPLL